MNGRIARTQFANAAVTGILMPIVPMAVFLLLRSFITLIRRTTRILHNNPAMHYSRVCERLEALMQHSTQYPKHRYHAPSACRRRFFVPPSCIFARSVRQLPCVLARTPVFQRLYLNCDMLTVMTGINCTLTTSRPPCPRYTATTFRTHGQISPKHLAAGSERPTGDWV